MTVLPRATPAAAGAAAATTADKAAAADLDFPVNADAAPLFQPLKLGALNLRHRIIMAPLTRCRSPNHLPGPNVATYYGQRASQGGLIISEATAICEEAHGYPQVPGIYTPEQVEAWKPVVKAVQAKGGLFLCQLWHVGRASHPDYQPGGALPVSASAIPIGDGFDVWTPKGGPFKYPTPRALEASELPGIVASYAAAARNAVAAGFDGVEVHGANGYLLDQFWKDSTNTRPDTDPYGGSDANKAKLLLEVMEAVAAAIGPERVGLRLSPYNTFLDATDTTERAIEKNVWLMGELGRRVPGLAYIHMVEPRLAGGNAEIEGPIDHSLEPFRAACSASPSPTPFLAAGGFKRDCGIACVAEGKADAVVLGRWFISNPDLPKRIAIDAPFAAYDRDTFYSPDPEKGYTDYPALAQE